MLQTLLLNGTYEPINFISDRRTFSLLAKGKVDIIETWTESKIRHGNYQVIPHPAILKLKYNIKYVTRSQKYSSNRIFKRDQYLCQYCGLALTNKNATIDHIKPKFLGGENSWFNCVTACHTCNNKKDHQTLEQSGMKLLNKPSMPEASILTEFRFISRKHPVWEIFLF